MTLWFSTGPVTADVVLPHILSDHMVVQQGGPIQIWGWAEPAEVITVSIGDVQRNARANQDGEWLVALPEMKAGGPHEITIKGKNTITLKDVLVGEVWLCSGQSNMEMGLHAVQDGEAECAAADHPQIRLFEVPQRASGQPRPDVDTTWQVCTPETVRIGPFDGFSAVAYFFGREIQKELNAPVGLIDSSWGGTRIEPWMPPEAFALTKELEPFTKQIEQADADYRKAIGSVLDPMQEWIEATRRALDEGTEIPLRPAIPVHQLEGADRTTGLYNGMIHPLVPYAIRGVLWYQGESNVVPYDEQYALKMEAMVRSWREAWREGDFPFYYVQIAPFDLRNHGHQIAPTVQADLREQQAEAMALIPKSGMVVISDISNLRDIHPANKQDVGKRLALWALAKTYGKEGIVYSGPIYRGMKIEGANVRVEFDYVGGGLASRDGKPLTWFELAGEDKIWHEATAEIDGNAVVVSSPAVPKPVAVRFGWSMLAEPNLMNKEGLPAAQFRSQKW